jgi:hypothetical protein
VKVVYVAGRFRGKTNWEIQQNVRRAEEVSLRVAELGGMPLCPHKNTEHFDGLLTAEFWLEGTLELMRRCDAVVLVPGWETSEGTKGEIAEANRLGIPVYTSVEGLRVRLSQP